MSERATTIADVAAEAGVSTATVSRAMNGGTVSAPTRRAVEAAARRLNYRRNDLARGLATGRTGVVGVLIPDVIGPLYAQMARGIEDALDPAGMHYMMVTDHRDPDQESVAIGLLLARRVDALILIGSSLGPASLRALLGRATPYVRIQPESDPEDGEPVVAIDDEGGIAAAVAHLAERGHARIAHVGGLRRDAAVRAAAFAAATAERGLDGGTVVPSDSTEEGGRRAGPAVVEAHRERGVTAVVCSNDRVAAGLYLALREAGVRVPNDLSVIGFDDLPWTPYLDPPLTTVRQPARAMGRVAAERILAALRGERLRAPERTPARLVVRSSVLDRRSGEVSAV